MNNICEFNTKEYITLPAYVYGNLANLLPFLQFASTLIEDRLEIFKNI